MREQHGVRRVVNHWRAHLAIFVVLVAANIGMVECSRAAEGDEPTPTPIATPLGTAPPEADVDGDGQISIQDLALELQLVVKHYAERTRCVVRNVYPTPPADAQPGCEWQWIIHASDLNERP